MTQNRETFSKGSPGSNNMIVGIRRFSALRAAGPRIWEPWRFRAVRRASARRAGSGRTRPFPVRDIFRGTDRTPVRHGSHGPWDRRRTAVYRHRPSLRAGPTAGRASSRIAVGVSDIGPGQRKHRFDHLHYIGLGALDGRPLGRGDDDAVVPHEFDRS